MELQGRIHSIERCGTVDGPGIRIVIFFQGCNLRCSYCHNPDTHQIDGGSIYTVKQLVAEVLSYRSFLEASGGGVTLSGGDPLCQSKFALECTRAFQEEGISVALDTSGGFADDFSTELIEIVDIVILDCKGITEESYLQITAGDFSIWLKNFEIIKKRKNDVWMRYVLVPDITDEPAVLERVAEFCSRVPRLSRFEVLPFHQMGAHKWSLVNQNYQLNDVEVPSNNQIELAQKIFTQKLKCPVL